MKALLVIVLVLAGCGGTEVGLVGPSGGLASERPLATEALETEAPLATEAPSDKPRVADLPVAVAKRTASVAQGATASVTIKTSMKASCDIDVQYKSGSAIAKGLDAKTADANGAITWKWQVGRNTTKGKWPISITCALGDRTGSADSDLTVR